MAFNGMVAGFFAIAQRPFVTHPDYGYHSALLFGYWVGGYGGGRRHA
jgi:hypothetical protein